MWLIARWMDRAWPTTWSSAARRAELNDHLGVHVHSEQVRSKFVMKISGDVGPFLLLQGEELIGQRTVSLRHAGQTLRHTVEAVLQAKKFAGTSDGHAAVVVARADVDEFIGEDVQRTQRPTDQKIDQDKTAYRRQDQHGEDAGELLPDGVNVIGARSAQAGSG